jgi:hypothetical protein
MQLAVNHVTVGTISFGPAARDTKEEESSLLIDLKNDLS